MRLFIGLTKSNSLVAGLAPLFTLTIVPAVAASCQQITLRSAWGTVLQLRGKFGRSTSVFITPLAAKEEFADRHKCLRRKYLITRAIYAIGVSAYSELALPESTTVRGSKEYNKYVFAPFESCLQS
jgi:hypothetical protein